MQAFKNVVVLLGYFLSFHLLPAQFVGGHAPSQPPSGKVAPSSLENGPVANSVDHFTGTLSMSYALGEVATLSGLSFPLTLSYSSASLTSFNPSHSSGIPYGDGWQLSGASLSVETAAFDFVPGEIPSDSLLRKRYTPEQARQVGGLYYGNPRLSLPGGLGGRLVYKYPDPEDADNAVYVLNGFETYIEAVFSGTRWEVRLPDGTVYVFAQPQFRERNPSQSTAYLADRPNATIVPQAEVMQWHLSEIYNPNHANGQRILFEYEGFGEVDFYAELKQAAVAYSLAHEPDLLPVVLPSDSGGHGTPQGHSPCGHFIDPPGNGEVLDSNQTTIGTVVEARTRVYSDVFLKSVTALDAQGGEMSRVELKYKSWRPEYELSTAGLEKGRFLLLSDPQVQRRDSLYSEKVVWFQGRDLGFSQTVFERGAMADSTVAFDPDWKRYMHPMAYQHPLSDRRPILHPSNPYLFRLDENFASLNPASNAWLSGRMEALASNLPQYAVPFTHSVLESPRIWGEDLKKMPSGDLYQVRSVIKRPGGMVAPDMNFDVRVASGISSDHVLYQSLNPGSRGTWFDFNHHGQDLELRYTEVGLSGGGVGYGPAGYSETGYELFSTRDRVVKWNPLYQQTGTYSITDNTFRLPNLPNEFTGFVLQIGPAADNLDFGEGSENGESYFHRYNNFQGTSLVPEDDYNLQTSSWFGTGAPLEPLWRTNRFYVQRDSLGNYFRGQSFERFLYWYYPPDQVFQPGELLDFGSHQPTALTREFLLDAISPGSYGLDFGNMGAVHEAPEELELQSIEVVRIAQNPWMLDSVIFTTTSGNYGYDRILVAAFKLEYECEQIPVLNNVNPSDSFATWASPYKLIGGDTVYRNLFQLVTIHRLGVDTSGIIQGTEPGVTHFSYLDDNRSTPDWNEANLMEGYWNELGGKHRFSYNFALADTARWVTQVGPSFSGGNRHVMGSGSVNQLRVPVASVTVEDESGGQTTDYHFFQPVQLLKSLDWDAHFSGLTSPHSSAALHRGFAKAVVWAPEASPGVGRARNEYYFRGQTGTWADTLLFGRLYETRSFGAGGQQTGQTEVDYEVSLAYRNGNYYQASTCAQFGGFPIQTLQNSIREYEPYYHYQGGGSNEMHSWFIYKSQERNTDFDPTNDRSITNVVQYSYYDWDSLREDTEGDYAEMYRPLFGTPNWFTQAPWFNSGTNRFSYGPEPSWQIASVTTTNEEVPDAYYRENYYYLFDIGPFVSQLNDHEGSLRPFYLAQEYGIRNTLYEKRSTSWNGNPDLAPISLSTFYQWDVFLDVPGDFIEEIDSSLYGSDCNLDDPGEFLRAANHTVAYCLGTGRPVERHRLVNEIIDDPRYIQTQNGDWFFFPIESYSSLDFATFDAMADYGNQNVLEACASGGFVIGPDSKIKYFGDFSASDGTVFYASFIQVAQENYGKEVVHEDVTEESEDRTSLVVFTPHEHSAMFCHQVHGYASIQTANQDLMGGGENQERQLFLDVLANQFFLRAVYQQADTLGNVYGNAIAAPNPDYPSPNNLWAPSIDSNSYHGTFNRYRWQPTAPTIRTYTVHERNLHGLVVDESDVRHLHTLYEYAKGKFIYEFDSCGEPRSFIARDHFGVPLSVTTTNFQEIERVTVFDYHQTYQLRWVLSPNRERTSYTYDHLGRLQESALNGIARANYYFSQWGGDTQLSWEDRTNENHITTQIIREALPLKQVSSRAWRDPLDRSVQSVSALQNGSIFETKEYSGRQGYDKWNRVVWQERPQVETMEHDLDYESALPGSDRQHLAYEEHGKSRLLRSADYGNSINGPHARSQEYRIISLDEFQQVTGATLAEISAVFPWVSGTPLPKTYLYQQKSVDEDGKEAYTFTDGAGRAVASLGFTDYENSSGLALTLYVHDAVGQMVRVIHPHKLESHRRYNVLGWMIESHTPDADTVKYFYNQAGDLKVYQDENLRIDDRFRVFDYDQSGRLLKEETTVLSSSVTAFNSIGVVPLQYRDDHGLLFRSIHSIGDEFFTPGDTGNTSLVMDALQSQEAFPAIEFPRSQSRSVREVRYDYPVDTVVTGLTAVDLNTLSSGLLALVPQQEYCLGRVSAELIYDDAGGLIEQSLFGYDEEGRGIWLGKQFAPDGILVGNPGQSHILRTTAFDLQGQPLRTGIDLNANGAIDLEQMYRYDYFGRLEEVLLGRGGQDYLVASYDYVLGTGQTQSVTYYAHSDSCPDPVPVDTVQYSYDHRYRLDGIASHFFDFNLYYDGDSPGDVEHHHNWNGAINGWKADYKVGGQGPSFFRQSTTYGFRYDHLNRLRAGDASIPEEVFPRQGEGYLDMGFGQAMVNHDPRLMGDTKYAYDAAGNLTGLWRYDYRNPEAPPVASAGENWTYHYAPGSNRLAELRTAGMAQALLSYDGNGNMSSDSRRGLSGFAYNERNLPTGYARALGDSVTYLYGAGDQRVWKSTAQGSTFYLRDAAGSTVAIYDAADSAWTFPISGLDLIAEFVLTVIEDSTEERVAQEELEEATLPKRGTWLRKVRNILLAGLAGSAVSQDQEGQMRPAPVVLAPMLAETADIIEQRMSARQVPEEDDSTSQAALVLKFLIKDHLGNIRVTHRPKITIDPIDQICTVQHELISVIDYYPYGKILRSWHKEGPERFMTTEHERDGESGLDYRGARYYDADYARFLSMDPLAAAFDAWSPYNYVLGNPVSLIDPDGRMPTGGNEGQGADANDPTDNVLPTVTITSDMVPSDFQLVSPQEAMAAGIAAALKERKRLGLYTSASHKNAVEMGRRTGLNSWHKTVTNPNTVGWAAYMEQYNLESHPDNYIWGSGRLESQMVVLDIALTASTLGVGAIAKKAGQKAISRIGARLSFSRSAGVAAVERELGEAVATSGLVANSSKSSYSVYQGFDEAGTVRYVGMTRREPSLRFAEHLRAIGTGKEFLRYHVVQNATNLSRIQARKLEQKLINQLGLKKHGGQLLNMRNSISPKFWRLYNIKH